MKNIKKYQDMPVWKLSHEYVLYVYKILRKFPKYELYALADQIRRAVTSVPSNIVEGFHRSGSSELHRFLLISRASLYEVNYQLLLAKDLDYISSQDFVEVERYSQEIAFQLNSLLKSLRK
jgi:four helix bundle protein